jgi:uncharacterized protein YgiM (DUF1202 family)
MAIALIIAFANLVGCSFLSLFGEEATPPATPTTTMVATRLPTATGTLPVRGTVAVGNLNLRSGPSDDYAILLVMNEGDEVTILEVYQTSDEIVWARVSLTNGTIGYCNLDYLTAP